MNDESIETVIKNINSSIGKRVQKPQFTPIKDSKLPTFV
jgi:hypothetical protein